jgi:hypothetical protein
MASRRLHTLPYYVTGTQVQDGEGKMLVIAVGSNTYEQMLLGGNKDDEEEDEDSGGRSILQVNVLCVYMCVYTHEHILLGGNKDDLKGR